MTGPETRHRLYAEFARVSQALASERRLELVDLLAQAPRRVEALAEETGMTVANVSQHLQVLKNARLVDSERRGTSVTYRLASFRVVTFWLALRTLGEERLPEIDRIRAEFATSGEALPLPELKRLLNSGDAILIDVRPKNEFQYGHIAGAISMPLDELDQRFKELPKEKRIITYCRGTYCLLADEAVTLLRRRGFDALRLEGGWPEWSSAYGDGAPGNGRTPRSRTGSSR